MPSLKPFRDASDHNVVNLYAFSGTIPCVKGTLVKIENGFDPSSTVQPVGNIGGIGQSYPNTVSFRWGIPHKVSVCGTGERPFGLTLYDTRETDENGELLVYKPNKQVEMQAVLSGQAVPILTRGIVMYSGIVGNQSPTGGTLAYIGAGGALSTAGVGTAISSVGKWLGPADSMGWALLKLEL